MSLSQYPPNSSDSDGSNVYFLFPDIPALKSKNTSEMDMVKILQNNQSSNDTIAAKITLLKQLLVRLSAGEQFPKLFMSLISCLTNDNKEIKKIALQIFELVDYYSPDTGKLLPEAILICNALKSNLEHPNEFIRAATLRLVSRYKDLEILDPIMPAVLANLDHHHQLVRRHALSCIASIVESSREICDYLSHLDERLFQLVSSEYNHTCRYFALNALVTINQEMAIEFYATMSNTLHIHHDSVVSAILSLIERSYASIRPKVRKMYVSSLSTFLMKIQANICAKNGKISSSSTAASNTISSSTIYHAAKLLLQLTMIESMVSLGIQTYVNLLRYCDNNIVKSLLVQDLLKLCKHRTYATLLSPHLTELLSVLPVCTDAIRSHVLEIAVSFSTNKNVDAIVSILKCEYLSLICNNHANNVLTEEYNTGVYGQRDVHIATKKFEDALLSKPLPSLQFSDLLYTSPDAYQQRQVVPYTSSSLSDADITFRKDLGAKTDAQQYRFILFNALLKIANMYPRVISTTLSSLLIITILDNSNPVLALASLRFVKEIVLTSKDTILKRYFLDMLLEHYHFVSSPEILRGVVYILGEFTGVDLVSSSVQQTTMGKPNQTPVLSATTSKSGVNTPGLKPNNTQQQQQQQTPQQQEADLFSLQYTSSFLINAVGLESLLAPQQFMEFQKKASETAELIEKGQNISNNTQKQQELAEYTSTINETLTRSLIINNDMLFTTTLLTALTKLVLKTYHFFHHIAPHQNTSIASSIAQFHSIHAQALLIITRVLKFAPQMNQIDYTHVMTSSHPSTISLHILAHQEYAGDYSRVRLDDFSHIYEYTTLGGIGLDASARLMLNFQILYKPEQYGYITNPTTGRRELVFATSQKALQSHIQSASSDHNNPIVETNISTQIKSDEKNKSANLIQATTFTTPINSVVPGLYQQLQKDHTITPVFTSSFGHSLGLPDPLATYSGPTSQIYRDNLSTLSQPPEIRLLVDGNNEEDLYTSPFATPAGESEGSFGILSAHKTHGTTLGVAIGAASSTTLVNPAASNAKSKLQLYQLTGVSDLIHCEAALSIHLYDITMEMTFINQTVTTLQNITLELQTSPDLTLMSPPPVFSLTPKPAPQPITQDGTKNSDIGDIINPNDSNKLSETSTTQSQSQTWKYKTTIRFKVNSTETGIIFGNISCEANQPGQTTTGHSARHIIYIQPVTIQISQYLHPAICQPCDYRSMWSEFEWENKVIISTNFTNPIDFIKHIIKITNMQCLTPLKPFILTQNNNNNNSNDALFFGSNNTHNSKSDDLSISSHSTDEKLAPGVPFVSANLYAVSSFGEQALLNISVEALNGRLSGYMRVRAKTHGVARSVGDLVKQFSKKMD